MRKLLVALTAVLLFSGPLLAQKLITGKVTDDKGNPIPNASVQVKGLKSGTVTKVDGTYALTLPANAKTLIFSSVDMTPQEVAVGELGEISISLKATDKSLQEVVVVGYGTQKRKDIIASISTISGNDIKNVLTQSLRQYISFPAKGSVAAVPTSA